MSNEFALCVVHQLREGVVNTSVFNEHVMQWGRCVVRSRSPYDDPMVFRQQWLRSPQGIPYRERALYVKFLQTAFRRWFRFLLNHVPCFLDTFEATPWSPAFCEQSLRFCLDQGWFERHEQWIVRGSYQQTIQDIGRTLEWAVAEWFRLTYSHPTLLQVRHGVEFADMPVPGDLDVVALFDEGMVVVECKSSSSDVDRHHVSLFLQRVLALHPVLAILLIDTAAPFDPARLDACHQALHELGLPPLAGSNGLYWSGATLYITNVPYALDIALRDVLQFHAKRHHKPLLARVSAERSGA